MIVLRTVISYESERKTRKPPRAREARSSTEAGRCSYRKKSGNSLSHSHSRGTMPVSRTRCFSPPLHSCSHAYHLQGPWMPQPVARQTFLPQARVEGRGGVGLHIGAAHAHAIGVLRCRMYGWQATRVRQAVLRVVQGAVLLAFMRDKPTCGERTRQSHPSTVLRASPALRRNYLRSFELS